MTVYKVKSSDDQIFELEEAVLMEFKAIPIIGSVSVGDAPIPLPKVNGQNLAKVIDYCKKHIEHKLNPLPEDEIGVWDRDFVNLDKNTLAELLMAADYLNVKDLFDLIAMTLAGMARDKTPEQLRDMFIAK